MLVYNSCASMMIRSLFIVLVVTVPISFSMGRCGYRFREQMKSEVKDAIESHQLDCEHTNDVMESIFRGHVSPAENLGVNFPSLPGCFHRHHVQACSRILQAAKDMNCQQKANIYLEMLDPETRKSAYDKLGINQRSGHMGCGQGNMPSGQGGMGYGRRHRHGWT